MAAKTTVMVAIRQRPASIERIWRSTRSCEVAVNLSDIRSAAPRVRVSSAPLTDSVSSIWTLRSASRRCRSAVIR